MNRIYEIEICNACGSDNLHFTLGVGSNCAECKGQEFKIIKFDREDALKNSGK